MNIGKKIRLERIFDKKSKKTIIVPMDHGVSVGPIEGLVNMAETIEKVRQGGANTVILHKGIAKNCFQGNIGLILHLSGSTTAGPDVNNKVLLASVEEAIRLGVDGVSVHVNIGAEREPEMLRDLGQVAEVCEKWAMPLLAMMYPRGKKIENEHDVKYVKMAARIGAELGADIIKTNYTGDLESFREVVAGCPVPVVVAGGPKMETDKEVLEMVVGAMKAGARGVSIGRNVFQHQNPEKMVRALARIVHEGKSVEEAMEELK
jgi:fructose-bisphosphate aldolase/2-amino-3,7-dideoxy-D-threo-hept-6-ulosonate synthase